MPPRCLRWSARNFVWTSQGALTAEFDPGRDAVCTISRWCSDFAQQGRDQDGGVENGPYWDKLAQFASDPAFYSASDKTSLICGPLLAEAADAAVLEQAQSKARDRRRFRHLVLHRRRYAGR